MNIIPKDVQLHTLDGGLDTDTAPKDMLPNRARYMLNVRTTTKGQKASVTNVMGNVLVEATLPAGENEALGYGADEENNEFFFVVWNENGFHTVFLYNEISNTVIPLLQSRTDSNDVDILTLDRESLINHVDVIPGINGRLITWCDGANKAVKFNRNKALDKTATGYGLDIERDFVVAYKKAPAFSPVVSYFTDATRSSNFLYGKLFKFCYRFYYDDGEISNYSDWSLVALPPNQSYSGVNTITYDNNGINVYIATGNRLVIKIEVAMKVGSQDWVTTIILDKKTLSITDDAYYNYAFYNDGADVTADQAKIDRQFSYLPDKPFCQAFVKNAMTYSKFYEGFDAVAVNASVAVRYQDLYLPDGTANQLNHPVFSSALITNGYNSGSLGVNKRYNAEWRFTIGFDVKRGNKFTLIGSNGQSGHYTFTYTANAEDTATTVANAFKSMLRGIGRGYPQGNNGISNESQDGSGNQLFDYTILGFWNESPMSWQSSVTPVSFQVLQDDGTSINLHKPGSSVKYAFAYEDDDGRKGLANTSDALVAYTGFITEVGDQKQAIHRISISHTPPSWARYYYLLRTVESGAWIQMLIQKVIQVDPDPAAVAAGNSQRYLDLVVGSLFTYQKLHPNTVISYDFAKGDRIRPIKYYDQANNNAKVLYPFIELEVLSYNINTQEVMNANVSCDGSSTITIDGVANTDYIGKTIAFNGYERIIIGVGGGNKYTLNTPVPDGKTGNPVVFPTFTYIDQRGVLRIKRPDNVSLVDLSLVEIYKPLLNDSVEGYKQFLPFGVKLEIGNYGTPQAYHAGTVQNQYQSSPSDPAIIDVSQGDAYERNRELPTNDVVPGTQILVDHITDANYSDFYESDLTSLGRVFPQDDGSGRKYFGSRTRFSNDFIEDTKINGISDFDNADRVDYDDPYGDTMLTKFAENRLLVFKYLKTAWAGVRRQRIESADGGGTMTTSQKLLSDLNYFDWDGGIGNNPESYVVNRNYRYFASAGSGVFLRLAGDGLDAISVIYNFDKDARAILAAVSKYNLKIHGGIDRENTEVIWTVPSYNNYLFKGGFVDPDWDTYNAQLPIGTTYEITQQPAHSSVSIDGAGMFQLVVGSTLGYDYFVYRARLSGGTYLPARKECFTVVLPANLTNGFQARDTSKYCTVIKTAFTPVLNTAYCLTVNNGFRARVATKYCLKIKVGFTPLLTTAYCLQTPVISLADFDFMVIRYVWATGAGIDLDSFTGFEGTGTIYDGVLGSRQNWVGYNQNPDPSTGATGTGSRVIPYGSSAPYLNWGTDNVTGSGVEAILVDIKKFKTDFPATPNPISVKMNAVWYNTLQSGDITVEVTTYKGGTMSLDAANHNFINSGGVLVNTISSPYNVGIQSTASLITNSKSVARMDYDKTTNMATLTLL